jgi:hypothetical protein
MKFIRRDLLAYYSVSENWEGELNGLPGGGRRSTLIRPLLMILIPSSGET